jgi:Lrp/AsnC family transcriptional regulator, leucine-responsive regulatory protein
MTQDCCVKYARRLALDDLDLELLDLLPHDASRTLRELGETVRLSPSAVHRRIARYDEAGLIARRVAVVDPDAVGGRMLAVALVAVEQGRTEDAALRARLLATPEVQQCYDVAGDWDYVVVLATPGMPECRELVARLLDEPGVRRVATLPVFESVKRGLELPLGRPGRSR